MKISVIIPVYNVEKYIEKCLDSVVNQTYKNIEIIIIDDETPDGSIEICKKYIKSDDRIILIQQKNKGLSGARNTGLKKATGEYVLFVDSDDYLSKDAVQKFADYITSSNKKLDVVSGNALKVNGEVSKSIIVGGNIEDTTGEIALKNQIKSYQYNAPVWLRIYRRNFLIEEQLFFEEGLLHEDEYWTPFVLAKSKEIRHIENTFYYYVERENSITKKKDKTKNIKAILSICNNLCVELKSKKYSIDLKILLEDYASRLYMNAITLDNVELSSGNFTFNKRIFALKKSRRLKTTAQAIVFLLAPKIYREIKNR